MIIVMVVKKSSDARVLFVARSDLRRMVPCPERKMLARCNAEAGA